ncbi:hypothetical protein ONK27_27020, partial [Salmonella enterica subsp. enterica serovar Virginia]|nr:hypothetical protein [Salmonella enterica subsp. enterica serovar Virginia]
MCTKSRFFPLTVQCSPLYRARSWNDGNGIYDRLAAELVRRHGSALGARLAADGRLKFGKVTALA